MFDGGIFAPTLLFVGLGGIMWLPPFRCEVLAGGGLRLPPIAPLAKLILLGLIFSLYWTPKPLGGFPPPPPKPPTDDEFYFLKFTR